MDWPRFHLGTNNEVFDVKVYAIYQALHNIDQRQERNHRYMIFVDSTAAIDRIQSDTLGPGQGYATAAIEACTGILSRSNKVVVRWVPANHDVLCNEMADRYAKAAAEETVPDSTASGGRPAYPMWREYLQRSGRVQLLSRSRSAWETPEESTSPHLGEVFGVSSFREHPSPSPAGITSFYPAMRRSDPA